MKKLLATLLFLFLLSPLCGTLWYVDNGASAGNDGTSWTDAWESLADITWGGGGVVAGDTLYISGGSTSKIYRETLTVGASGSNGSPIAITKGVDGSHDGTVSIYGSELMTTWVTHESSTNYGDAAAPGSADAYGANYIYFHKISITTGGTGASISLYIQNAPAGKPGSGDIKCALYTDVAGEATDLVTNGTTEEKAWSGINHSEWTTFTFGTPPTVTATDYWIAVWSDQQYSRANAAGGSNNWKWDSETYDGWPSTASIGATASISDMDAYLTVDSGDNVWKKTGVTTEPYAVIFDGTWGEYESGGIGSLGTEKEWYWAADVLYVYTTGGDPDDQWPSGIEVGQRDNIITFSSKDYIYITDIDLRYGNRYGFNIATVSNCLFEDLTIFGTAESGVLGNTITNNTFRRITWSYGCKGFGLATSSDSNIFEYCDLSESRTTKRGAGGGGFMLYDCDSNIMRYNFIHDARLIGATRWGDGIFLDISGDDCNDNEIYYNIITKQNDAIDISGDGNIVYNNIFYLSQYPAIHYDTASNSVVKNNIIYGSVTSTFLINTTSGEPTADNTIENNCYYDPNNTDGSSDFITWNAVDESWGNMTWAEWVAHAKYDQSSFWADPLFVDAANGDFRLLMGSPCIDAGADVSLTTDYRGRSIRHAPDIGAYEDPTNAVFMARLFKYLKEKKDGK